MSAVQLAVEDHPGIIGQWRTPVISRATRRGMRTARRQRRGRWRVPDDCADGHNRETRTLQWDGGTRATWRTVQRGRRGRWWISDDCPYANTRANQSNSGHVRQGGWHDADNRANTRRSYHAESGQQIATMATQSHHGNPHGGLYLRSWIVNDFEPLVCLIWCNCYYLGFC